MRRRRSAYPRTSYRRAGGSRASSTSRSSLTRRALLGALSLVGAGGLVEAFRGSGHHAATVTSKPPHPLSHQTVGSSNQGSIAPGASGSHGASSRAPNGPGPHHGHGDAPPPHQHGSSHHHGAGHQNGQHSHGKSGHHETARFRRENNVTLPPPTVRVRSRPIYSVADIDPDPPKRAIALTVDDGPDPDWTPKVLRLLDKHRMQASFCVVGIHADSYPRLIRDIHKAGHVLVNHSYTHIQPFAQQTERRIVDEITKTQRAIERAAKVTPELFRSPGGDWSHFVYRAIASYGLTPLDWDVDPMDWAMPGTAKIERAMLRGRPGDIVLCHDGGGNRSETVRALRKVLPTWKHRNYTTIALIVPERAKRITKSPTSPPPSSTPSTSPSASTTGTPTP